MNEKPLPQYAKVEQPFGCEPPLVHCPICGSATMDPENGGATPCPHLAFIYVGEVQEFEFKSQDFEARMSRLDEEEVIELEEFSSVLEKLGYSNSLLALEITYGGMACGPVWYTVIFGFDYESLNTCADSASD